MEGGSSGFVDGETVRSSKGDTGWTYLEKAPVGRDFDRVDQFVSDQRVFLDLGWRTSLRNAVSSPLIFHLRESGVTG